MSLFLIFKIIIQTLKMTSVHGIRSLLMLNQKTNYEELTFFVDIKIFNY